MLLVGGYIRDYFPVNRRDDIPDSTLCVVTYNTGYITGEEKSAQLIRFVKILSPDILCLQEISNPWFNRKDVQALMDSMNYKKIGDRDLFILTRLPVLGDTLHITYPSRNHNTKTSYSLACWLSWNGDSVLWVNNHLESNQLSPDDKDEYRGMLKDPHREKVRTGSRHLMDKLGTAVRQRGKQADILAALADSLRGHSVLICGDFNDTPISYTYQRLARKMKSAYRESGNGIGRSFNQTGFYVRIDHLFMTPDWTSYHTRIDRLTDLSDHYPLVTYLKHTEKE